VVEQTQAPGLDCCSDEELADFNLHGVSGKGFKTLIAGCYQLNEITCKTWHKNSTENCR
jgi:hypothetical protein